ncbi:MAG: penicillin-binding protein 2 [Chitinophagales bacterium]|nr:penicillin-binding protein 2 [Chitinophagales bacterium]MDW8393911.1 penicillin-binding protein 2 [Chitinophagales bacterium]
MTDVFQNRRYVIQYVVVAVVIVYVLRLFQLQVLSKNYQQLARNNVLREVTVFAPRGLIYDRKGKLIVDNQNEYDLWVVPSQVQAFDTAAFCSLIGISDSLLRLTLKKAAAYSRFKPSLLLKGISVEKYAAIQEELYLFPGFFGQVRTVRAYPHQGAAHLLGYIGEVSQSQIEQGGGYYRMGDYIGISGLEQFYENELRGRKGSRFVLVDVHNREQGAFAGGSFDTAAIPGYNLLTTLDMDLQLYGELLMKNKVGSIVAIEPATGEVLALVSSPAYDPSLLTGMERTRHFRQLASDSLRPLFVRPLKAAYPPGSTFKPAVALAAMQLGSITPRTGYSCAGAYSVGSLSVACHHAGYVADVQTAIQYSCNSYFCHIFRKTIDDSRFNQTAEGLDQWKKVMDALGIGRRTGIDLPNEGYGYVPGSDYYDKIYGKKRWNSVTIVSLGIGQGELGMTPLQMANLMAAIANGGYWITPHVVRSVQESGTGKPIKTARHIVDLDTNHLSVIREGLFRVVEAGTGRGVRIPGITLAGKTGTAENPHGRDHSLFVGFAPLHQPRIAIAVVVENAGWGASYAAPIASLMVEKYLTDTISHTRKYLEQRMLEANLLP